MKLSVLFTNILFVIVFLSVGCKKPPVRSIKTNDTIPNTTPATDLAQNLINANTGKETIILTPDSAWEAGSLYNYSVFQKDSITYIYYVSGDLTGHKYVCYAYSKDGIHFIRPNLGQVTFNGNKNNNILKVGLDAIGFFWDSSSIKYPYKLIGLESDFKQHVSSSTDGIHWVTSSKPLVDYFCDAQNQIIYDAEQQKYKYYLRNYIYDPQILHPYQGSSYYYRGVAYFEADSLQEIKITGTPIQHPFSTAPVISTELPTIINYDRSLGEADIYTPSVVKYAPGVYISYASVFHHFPPPPVGQFANDGYCSIALYTSTDGKNFSEYRTGFIDQNPTTNHLANGFACTDSSLRNYYYKTYNTHGNPVKVSAFVMREYKINAATLSSIKAYNGIK